MIKKKVDFFGAKRDENGMPTPFFSYFIVASDSNLPGFFAASAMQISGAGTPSLETVFSRVDAQDAFDALLTKLRGISIHAGLSELVKDVPQG